MLISMPLALPPLATGSAEKAFDMVRVILRGPLGMTIGTGAFSLTADDGAVSGSLSFSLLFNGSMDS